MVAPWLRVGGVQYDNEWQPKVELRKLAWQTSPVFIAEDSDAPASCLKVVLKFLWNWDGTVSGCFKGAAYIRETAAPRSIQEQKSIPPFLLTCATSFAFNLSRLNGQVFFCFKKKKVTCCRQHVPVRPTRTPTSADLFIVYYLILFLNVFLFFRAASWMVYKVYISPFF